MLCNSQEENLNHLLLHCTFAKAVWLGMEINTTVLIESIISVDMWISKLLESYGDATNLGELLTMVITTAWCLWFHKNQVCFEDKLPDPIEVLLTAQSLTNRYKQLAQTISFYTSSIPRSINIPLPEDWQNLILTAGVA